MQVIRRTFIPMLALPVYVHEGRVNKSLQIDWQCQWPARNAKMQKIAFYRTADRERSTYLGRHRESVPATIDMREKIIPLNYFYVIND